MTPHQEKFDGVIRGLQGLDGSSSSLINGPLTRRKLLGGLLLATAGTASVAGLSLPRTARAATVNTMTRAGNPITLGPILAPDGLPQASIQGTFAGVNGAYCLVNAGDSVVPVTVLPSTQVLAGGALANGSLSALAVGDHLFIFTTIVESGERVASKIEQNPRLYNLEVATITGSQIGGTTLSTDATPGIPLQLTVNALTNWPQTTVPQVGSNIRAATIRDSNSRQVVAMNVTVLKP
jgi:hypothetical protein